jgi:hypothetical protein
VDDKRYAPAGLPREGNPMPTAEVVGLALGSVRIGTKNLARTEFRTPDPPVSSGSL